MPRMDVELYGAYNRARVAQLGGRVIDVDSREHRVPAAATQPLSYTTVGQPMLAEWNADQAVRYGYLANVVVFRCVQVVAEVIAGLPFRAGLDPDKPTSYNTGARLARLLGPPPDGPNPETAGSDLWAWSVAQYLVTGRFGWEIEQAQRTREVVALWPLVSCRLEAVPSESGAAYFSGFRYGRVDKPKHLSPDQVHYQWRPSLTDWRQPESALQAARLDVSIAVMQDRYNYAFLKNDARPAAVIVHDAFAERGAYDAFKDQFRSEYGGPDNAGKVAFAEVSEEGEGEPTFQVHTLGLTQKDAEFAKLYEAKLRGICIALGVPFSLLDASGRTFDNAGQESKNWWTTKMLPLIRTLQNRVNLTLAPRLGSEVGWFDLSGVEALRPVKKFTQFTLGDLLDNDVVTVDEVREDFGLPPAPEREEPAAAEVVLTNPDDGPSDALLALAESLGVAVDRLGNLEVRHPHEPVDHEQRRARIWRGADAQVRALERTWERRWRSLFARQSEAAVKRLQRQVGRQVSKGEQRATNPDEVFDRWFWETQTTELAAGLYEDVFAVGGARLAERFGLAFDLDAPYAQRFIQSRANMLAGQVTSTTYDAIKDQLARGVAAGEDIDTLAGRIRGVFAEASKTRATTIARTEVISAFNGSASVVASELGGGIVGGQEWIATRDARTRGEHADADGQVVEVGMPFIVGGDALDYPGDGAGSAGNTVNCRCAIAFLTPDEMGRARPSGEVRMVSLDDVEKLAVRVALGQTELRAAVRSLAA